MIVIGENNTMKGNDQLATILSQFNIKICANDDGQVSMICFFNLRILSNSKYTRNGLITYKMLLNF